MFEPQPGPRVFATPLGADFIASLIDGLRARLAGQPPEALARVEVFVNTTRIQRRLRAQFSSLGPGFVPRIRLVSDLDFHSGQEVLPPAISPLHLRLELAELIRALMRKQPGIAPGSALFDLADSLADLIGEMHEEQVTPDDLRGLDVGDHSLHWQRSLAFLDIVTGYFEATGMELTQEARQSLQVERLARHWQSAPPAHPVIVAGTTGSRGATARFMAAVAALPQGAVILPGLDRDMPPAVWEGLLDERRIGLGGEDHPQFRLGRFLSRLGLDPQTVPDWSNAPAPHPARNKLVSLALRPAPVTDQWLAEGPGLQDLEGATRDLSLVEAPNPQAEASAIALRLRKAAEDGQRAALISPDKTLTRQVTAALDRWGIYPDDSAGQAYALTPSGRLLRHLAGAMARPVDNQSLLELLKHPLTHSGRPDRGEHLRRSRDLEIQVLRRRVDVPGREVLLEWAKKRESDGGCVEWAAWLADHLDRLAATPARAAIGDHVAATLEIAHTIASGPGAEGWGDLWESEVDGQVRDFMRTLSEAAEVGGEMSAAEYRDFLDGLLKDGEARNPIRPHAGIMIWGALEARVQGADLLILAGLNDGVWPTNPGADPWLNRAMRNEAGLRLPDRQIGLSAHDFQQAIAAREVWITRSLRDAETKTVPSRWLNRLMNLMQGIGAEGAQALAAMRKRGDDWLAMAEALSLPEAMLPAAPRPSPRAPVDLRLTRLSVTQVEKLIRDPYAIYASKLLRLGKLDPLSPAPDARSRGIVMHAIMKRFAEATRAGLPADAHDVLMRVADEEFAAKVPWPMARRLWRAQLAAVAPLFLETEAERRRLGTPTHLETKGEIALTDIDLELSAFVDRIDLAEDGSFLIYDYKTGDPPTEEQERLFNKQLRLEALMARKGAFGSAPGTVVRELAYIGLNKAHKIRRLIMSEAEIDQFEAEFAELIAHHRRPDIGFTSRRAMQGVRWEGDFDHLARYGEWDDTTAPTPIDVGPGHG